ncbi:hsp90 co-chaperone Cdc37-like [Centruroides sculpturatus]|uniref:hsp90 co-chaperone Cdc37-like n=1 Tax=Centruroides sculpturatus TaxID=218467 RepID=UPI000C6DBD6D|nr:hsp90 co-chaperone Cdc37-like [Centruroides sculpturatus]
MVDYSKWKEIEISDDEDDTHPNIDTASLFRWRHQARLERMTEFEKEKTTLENSITESQRKITELKNKLKEGEGTGIDLCAIKKSIAELEDEEKRLKTKNTELLKKEKVRIYLLNF